MHDITKIFPEIALDNNGVPYANKEKTPPGFAYMMGKCHDIQKKRYTTEEVKSLKDWQETVISKLLKCEDDWLRANLFKHGVPEDESAKLRCKLVKEDKAHIWNSTLYIDDKIVSILSVNSVTMEAIVSNDDGFTSKGT